MLRVIIVTKKDGIRTKQGLLHIRVVLETLFFDTVSINSKSAPKNIEITG